MDYKGGRFGKKKKSVFTFSFKCFSGTLGAMISCSCVREAKLQAIKEIKFVVVFVMPSSNDTVMQTNIIGFLPERLFR